MRANKKGRVPVSAMTRNWRFVRTGSEDLVMRSGFLYIETEMLGRYTMYRGKPPAGKSLPEGIRQDTRKHTRHVLRPSSDLVEAFLNGDGSLSWNAFRKQYWQLLETRFGDDPSKFEELASLADENDVYIGCSCPTRKNPDLNCCHTVVALRFMKGKFPDLEVEFPSG